jgi:quinoprotein dehydrogenase-associated probable ABC transporter substrate-binding protein
LLCLTASLLLAVSTSAFAGPPELMERGALRVCADGNNLPFSNQAGEGFENRIAELMAEDLGLPLNYVWAPQIMGFVRNTLELRVCDVIIGVASGYEFVQNTNAYYRSVYAVVLPHDAAIEPNGLADPAFRGLRIGAVANTPPLVPLRQAGASLRVYRVHVDTRAMTPARDAVADVAAGTTDAAVVWGPVAGYYADRHDPPLKVVPLDARSSENIRIDFRITMGIRRNEPLWKDWINDFIDRRQDEIDAILAEYGVPLLDARGALIHAGTDSTDEVGQ